LWIKGSGVTTTPEPLENESKAFGDSKDLYNTKQDFDLRYGTSLARKKLLS
jgi:hypothetical protein